MRHINFLRTYVATLILLLAGWGGSVGLNAQTLHEVVPEISALQGTDNGTAIQPLTQWHVNDFGLEISFNQGSSSYAPAYYHNTSNIRLYKGNTFTLNNSRLFDFNMIIFVAQPYKSSANTLTTDNGEIIFEETTEDGESVHYYYWIPSNPDFSTATFSIVNDTQLRIARIYIDGNYRNQGENADVYVRGTFNNWGVSDVWKMTKSVDGSYSFNCSGATILPAGSEFKIADANWSLINYGPIESTLQMNTPMTWVMNGQNGQLTQEFEGQIRCVLNGDGVTSTVTMTSVGSPKPLAPVFSVSSGTFTQDFNLEIQNPNDSLTTIRYTLDGSNPSADNGVDYTGPINIKSGADVTVKAAAFREDKISDIVSVTYTYVRRYDVNVKVVGRTGIDAMYISSNSDYKTVYDGQDCSITALPGEKIDLSFTMNTGYKIERISSVVSTLDWPKSYYFTMPSKDVDIEVKTIFDPSSPSEPQAADTTRLYSIELVANPSVAATMSTLSKQKVGASLYISATVNQGYVFENWTKNGQVVSTTSSFYYTMPAEDVVLTANYKYNPSSPGDPAQPTLKHPLTVVASPAGAATFYTSASSVTMGDSYNVTVYPNPGYAFKGWLLNGKPIDANTSTVYGTMTEEGAHYVALCVFNPASPGNPGANSYNATTGEAIIDDFSQGGFYSAISKTIGSNNYSNVCKLIVKGQMISDDWRYLSYFKNAEVIDLSRVGGIDYVPSYSFQNMNVNSIILGANIGSIKDYAFDGCANLASLTLYSTVPPKCSTYAKRGLNTNSCSIYVPAEALELYSNDSQWKDFYISPITKDVHILQISLPEMASDGRYKNCVIELVNVRTGVRMKYVVSDRILYTFNGLQKDEEFNAYLLSQSGIEIGRIENIVIPDKDIAVAFEEVKTLQTVTAKVVNQKGDILTNQASIEWLRLKDDGSSQYLRKATSVNEIPVGQQLICRVTLDSKLGTIYAMPSDSTYTTLDGANTCVITLRTLKSVVIKGKVVDSDGVAIANASVSASQNINGKFNKTFTTKTDRSGVWTLGVMEAPQTQLSFSALECVTVNDTVTAMSSVADSIDVGCHKLRSIVGARITYGFKYQAVGAEDVQDYYSDYQNVAISVFNVTQNRVHKDVSQQYPLLAVLDEKINAGNQLKLTATSKTGAFNPIVVTATIGDNQRASVTFDIVGKGGISSSFEMTENKAVTALLYSGKGELLKTATYNEANIKFTELEDGNYTIVSMGQSDLMNSILRLANFTEIGLVEGKDYVKNEVTVESGKLSEIKISEVPAFDESLFYYTSSNTSFSTNKSSITTGNFLTLRSAIDFKGVYKNDIHNVALVVDLPEACDFVEQSVVQGSNLLPYTLDNNRLTIQLNDNYRNQTRFCVIPTAGGSFNATASIVFDYKGRSITQPIGLATSEIKDLEITVPSLIAGDKFKVSGTSLGYSEIKIYEDGSLLGNGKANAAGSWTVECKLLDPYNLSVHPIYAEITTPAGNTLTSESKNLTYDKNAIQVSKVTMYHYNPEMKKTYESEFDFLNPKTTATQWTVYYPKKQFTYTIEFTVNDPERISNVILYVHTADGKVVPLTANFDENKSLWFAEIDMGTASNEYYPVTCSVDFDYDAPLLVDKRMVDESFDNFTEFSAYIKENNTHYTKLINEIDSFSGNSDELIEIYKEFDRKINFSYSSELNDDEIAKEVAKLSSMTFDEQVEYASNYFSSITASYETAVNEDQILAYDGLNGKTIVTIDGIEYSIVKSEAIGFDETTAETNGFTKVESEGFCFYTRASSNPMSYEVVDVTRNVHVLLQPLSNIDSTKLDAKRSKDLLDALFEATLEELEGASEALNTATNLVMDLVEFAEDLVSHITRNSDKAIEIAERMAADSYNQGVLDGDMSSYHYWKKEAANLKLKKNNAFKWLDEVKGFKSTILTKKANLALNINTLITDVRNWWQLYHNIKGKLPCEGNPEWASHLYGEVKYYATGVCTLDALNVVSSCMALRSAVLAAMGAVESGGTSIVIGGAAALTLQGVSIIAGLVGSHMSNKMYQQLLSAVNDLKCSKDCGQPGKAPCPDPKPQKPNGGDHHPGTPKDNVTIDPSGYVYEAVPENRIAGVQATIYYKETKEDMYGDPYEEIILWNAEEYAQKNPLFTDENGMYQWDVPQGLWQVKFEKDGYQTAYSEWLPVPPPQLEVNIGMVQAKQPEVTEARAYEEGVEVKFDKFMDQSTLTGDNIFVTAGGDKLKGSISLLNSTIADEYVSETDSSAVRYASRIRFVPEQKLASTTGEIRLTISGNVKSYAGIPMGQNFAQTLDVEKEVQKISAENVKVLYGGTQRVAVSALPFEAAVGRKLRVENLSNLIASVDTTEYILDEKGMCEITVKGNLPGRSQLKFSIDGVTATGECSVDVVTEIVTAQAPKSSRASGTAVYRGTKVELTTDSKNSIIYFTTDGTCPCDENGTRRKYTVPIVIDDDTKILAITYVGNDEDNVSEIVEFNYTLRRSDMDLQMDKGWTWMSHNFEKGLAVDSISKMATVDRIQSQTKELIRDPKLGMVGNLTMLSASECYKVQTSATTDRQRVHDYAWNPATPIAIQSGWNWLGYPVPQTMTVNEALATTKAESLDLLVGQNGFAQFDGESWIGTLETLSPGMGYMYQSQSPKNVVYNTSIVSTAAALNANAIGKNLPVVLDIHKYGKIMPIIASIHNSDGATLDSDDYQVLAFSGSECRGIGRVIKGLVMMNVYGDVSDPITFHVTDAGGNYSFSNNVSLQFCEGVVGDLFNPYAIRINNQSGVEDVRYDGNIKVVVDGNILRFKGIAPSNINLVEVYDINGQKLVHETHVSEFGLKIPSFKSGVYVVLVNGNGEYTYHKIAVR